MQEQGNIIIIGYSGHAFVVIEAIYSNNGNIIGYCETQEKEVNPYNLPYLGSEMQDAGWKLLKANQTFIAVGDNGIRRKIFQQLKEKHIEDFPNIAHISAIVSPTAFLGKAVLISANATINALAKIGNGVICNTACIIEHECQIGDFAHIAPGAVLAGNVTIGDRTFVGANTVIKQGIIIGNDVTIGAGSVIIRDIPDGATVVGNPGKIIKRI